MKKDIQGTTRTRGGLHWAIWWLLVFVAVFLFYQLSRPLWDADRLVAEKRQSCEKAGLVMVKEEVRFGTNYSCKDK